MGPVVDVVFEDGNLPEIKDALEVENNGKRCVMEVSHHLGNNMVRCIMLSASEGLQRDREVIATGSGIKVPVGDKTLGRLFNVLGDTVDDGPSLEGEQKWVIHRDPPDFEHQKPAGEILEILQDHSHGIHRRSRQLEIGGVDFFPERPQEFIQFIRQQFQDHLAQVFRHVFGDLEVADFQSVEQFHGHFVPLGPGHGIGDPEQSLPGCLAHRQIFADLHQIAQVHAQMHHIALVLLPEQGMAHQVDVGNLDQPVDAAFQVFQEQAAFLFRESPGIFRQIHGPEQPMDKGIFVPGPAEQMMVPVQGSDPHNGAGIPVPVLEGFLHRLAEGFRQVFRTEGQQGLEQDHLLLRRFRRFLVPGLEDFQVESGGSSSAMLARAVPTR